MTALVLSITLGTLAATDRPDMTESTESVAPKTIQLESDIFSFSRSFKNRNMTANFGNILLKTGLFKNGDLHFGWSNIPDGTFSVRLRKSFKLFQYGYGAVIPYLVFDVWTITSYGMSVPLSFIISDRLSIASMYSLELSVEEEILHMNTLSFG